MGQDIIVVHGATGAQGRPVIEKMLAEGHKVRAVSRSGSSAELGAGVEGFASDLLDVDVLARAYDGAAAVILVLPGGATDDTASLHVDTMLAALKQAQVPRAIFNASGALWDVHTGVPMIDARTKLAEGLADAVKQSAVVAPAGMFFEVFTEGWVLSRLKDTGELVGPAPADAPMQPVAMADLAQVMVDLLATSSDEIWPSPTFIKGPEPVTGTAFAAEIASQTGKEARYLQIGPAEHMASVAQGLSPQYAKNIGALYGPEANVPPPAQHGSAARLLTGSTGLTAFVASQTWA